jgi:formylglycine-generating enzyme
MPVTEVSWGDAARFCNWLQNGQPSGTGTIEGTGTTETGAYTFDGATTDTALMLIIRNTGAIYFIPTEDEWYKAAYYKGGGTGAGYWLYPTRSNTAPSNVLSTTGTNNANVLDSNFNFADPTNYLTPVGYFAGSPGPYGTFDQGGDVFQWNETTFRGSYRGVRGGSFALDESFLLSSCLEYDKPTNMYEDSGFRVAEVPEPGSIALLLAGGTCLLGCAWRWRKRAA